MRLKSLSRSRRVTVTDIGRPCGQLGGALVVSGLANTRKLMEAVDSGKADYDFVEVMACPGGCAGGGGQPIHDGVEMASSRGSQLWKLDAKALIRFSHENPDVQELYHAYLKKPLGEKSHHLLHTDHDAWDALPDKA